MIRLLAAVLLTTALIAGTSFAQVPQPQPAPLTDAEEARRRPGDIDFDRSTGEGSGTVHVTESDAYLAPPQIPDAEVDFTLVANVDFDSGVLGGDGSTLYHGAGTLSVAGCVKR